LGGHGSSWAQSHTAKSKLQYDVTHSFVCDMAHVCVCDMNRESVIEGLWGQSHTAKSKLQCDMTDSLLCCGYSQ